MGCESIKLLVGVMVEGVQHMVSATQIGPLLKAVPHPVHTTAYAPWAVQTSR
jgi:hypothetical protein